MLVWADPDDIRKAKCVCKNTMRRHNPWAQILSFCVQNGGPIFLQLWLTFDGNVENKIKPV